MPQIKKIFILISLSSFIFMGFTDAPKEIPAEAKTKGPSFIIGLVPEQNIFKQLARYEPLAEYLSKKIGAQVELKVLTSYGDIIDNIVSAGLDAAFFGSFTYTLAHAKLNIEAIARPEDMNGVSSYHGLIFVRKDSGIKDIKDMKGKRFAFVDRATTAGYLFPLAFFREHGIKDYETFLKETYFAGTHAGAIYDVLNKKADIGAAKNTIFDRVAGAEIRIKNELIILQRSSDVPENGLAVRKDLDDSIKNKLKETLVHMHNDRDGMDVLRNFGAGRFIKTTNGDYANVYELINRIGLNLATYHYWNE